jgi:penicillin-insensitive murein endopeptidase
MKISSVHKIIHFLLIFCVGCQIVTSKPQLLFSPPSPSKGASESLGKVSQGCLRGGLSLYPLGVGYQVMRPSRQRYWGHGLLVNWIEEFGRWVSKSRQKNLLVGDLSQARGGPLVGGHKSHQNGLDVDIWYEQTDFSVTNFTFAEREFRAPLNLVNAGHVPAWVDETLKWVAEHVLVERVFVHPFIKKQLCYRVADQEWLRKIRPWWGHDDHFHVRLVCPKDDKTCTQGPPLGEGTGCDQSLEWWWTDEAKAGPPPTDQTKAEAKEQILWPGCKELFEEESAFP